MNGQVFNEGRIGETRSVLTGQSTEYQRSVNRISSDNAVIKEFLLVLVSSGFRIHEPVNSIMRGIPIVQPEGGDPRILVYRLFIDGIPS